jgi:CRP-like cAMP-binding protein
MFQELKLPQKLAKLARFAENAVPMAEVDAAPSMATVDAAPSMATVDAVPSMATVDAAPSVGRDAAADEMPALPSIPARERAASSQLEAPTPTWLRPHKTTEWALQLRQVGNLARLWNGALRRCLLLQRLSPAELNFVLAAARPMKTSEGEWIYSAGDPVVAGYFYLVARGRFRATVTHKGEHRVTARDYVPMENFGSCEMLGPRGVRESSLQSLSSGFVWAVPQRVVATSLRIPRLPPIPGLVEHAMQVKLFRILSSEQLQQVCRCAKRVIVPAGGVLCRQGDPARAIYTILHGSVYTSALGSTFSITLVAPESLGESALAADEETRVRSSSVFAGRSGVRHDVPRSYRAASHCPPPQHVAFFVASPCWLCPVPWLCQKGALIDCGVPRRFSQAAVLIWPVSCLETVLVRLRPYPSSCFTTRARTCARRPRLCTRTSLRDHSRNRASRARVGIAFHRALLCRPRVWRCTIVSCSRARRLARGCRRWWCRSDGRRSTCCSPTWRSTSGP